MISDLCSELTHVVYTDWELDTCSGHGFGGLPPICPCFPRRFRPCRPARPNTMSEPNFFPKVRTPHHSSNSLSKQNAKPHLACSMPRRLKPRRGMTEFWAILIFQVNPTIGACRGSPRRNPAAPSQAIRDAEDDGNYPRMPKDDVLRGLLERGMHRQLGHDMPSLKAWIRANRCRPSWR